ASYPRPFSCARAESIDTSLFQPNAATRPPAATVAPRIGTVILLLSCEPIDEIFPPTDWILPPSVESPSEIPLAKLSRTVGPTGATCSLTFSWMPFSDGIIVTYAWASSTAILSPYRGALIPRVLFRLDILPRELETTRHLIHRHRHDILGNAALRRLGPWPLDRRGSLPITLAVPGFGPH